MTRLRLRPVDWNEARAFVRDLHRHRRPPRGHKFSIGAEIDGRLVGAAIVGRPVSKVRDDRRTLEVTRLATDGTKNACSFLYGAAARAAFALGFLRIGTYTRKSEPGTSLVAAGWQLIGEVKGRSWNCPSRPRAAPDLLEDKRSWERVAACGAGAARAESRPWNERGADTLARRKRQDTTESGDAVAAEEARDERAEQRGSNSAKTKKEVAAAHERLNRMEGTLETARGKLRAEWKKLKEEGFNTKALKRARKELREDPLDAQMDLEDYMTYRELLGVDDAVQAARQAEDNEANAASVDAASIPTQKQIAAAHDEGFEAGRAAKDKGENPYPDGSPKFLAWQAGWIAGQRQNLGAGAAQPEPATADA